MSAPIDFMRYHSIQGNQCLQAYEYDLMNFLTRLSACDLGVKLKGARDFVELGGMATFLASSLVQQQRSLLVSSLLIIHFPFPHSLSRRAAVVLMSMERRCKSASEAEGCASQHSCYFGKRRDIRDCILCFYYRPTTPYFTNLFLPCSRLR